MCAQRLMEGESYVTISMYPYILQQIRVGLNAILERPTSAQVYSLARKMNLLLEEHWGGVEPGTVAQEHISVGHMQRPKGIPKLELLASLLDPRFKFGAGLDPRDRSILLGWLVQEMTRVAIATVGEINNINNNNGIQQRQPNAHGHAGRLYDDLFQDLQLMAQAENNNNNYNNNVIAADNGPFDEDAVEERVQAEMVLYK
jgi:hypothetical protein